MKIKIAYMINYLGYGGVEKYVLELASRLSPEKFSPVIISLKNGGPLKNVVPDTIPTYEMNKKWTGNDWKCPFKISHLLKREGAHIVHSNNWSTFFEAVFAKTFSMGRIGLIHAQHGMQLGGEEFTSETLRQKRNHIRKIFSFFTDRVVTVSKATNHFVCDEWGVKNKKVQLIYNGVDLSQFSEEKPNRDSDRRKIGIAEDDILIGAVGRLEPIKNYPSLIQAVAELSKKYPRIKCVFIGDGRLQDTLTKLSEELHIGNAVQFLGRRNDVKDLLKCFDVFVLPSFSEGVSLALIEAMATGLPVVASEVGGNPEVIHHEVDGLLYESDNVHALCAALSRVIDDSDFARKLGNEARKCVYDGFSIETMIQAYESLYEQICWRTQG